MEPDTRSKIKRAAMTAVKWGLIGSLLVVRDNVRAATDMGRTVKRDLRRATPDLAEAKNAWTASVADPEKHFAELARRHGLTDADIDRQITRYHVAKLAAFAVILGGVLFLWANPLGGIGAAAMGAMGFIAAAYRESVLRNRKMLSFRDWCKGGLRGGES